MKKNKKTKSKVVKQEPFDFGLDAEQTLADALCNKYLQEDANENHIDEAFEGAFKGLAHRMLTIFKKEYVFQMVADMAAVVDEEEGGQPHVCDDCKAKMEEGTLPNEVRNKMH